MSTGITLESNTVIDGQGHTIDGAGIAERRLFVSAGLMGIMILRLLKSKEMSPMEQAFCAVR